MHSFITSRKQRALRAKTALANTPEKVTAASRAAYTEYYLLDDVVRLLEYRSDKSENSSEQSGKDELARALEICRKAMQAAKEQLDIGNFKAVRRAIPERKLLSTASAVNGYSRLIEIANGILLDLGGFSSVE